VESVSRDLVGLHSSDAASVYLAATARVPDFSSEQLERALYDERTLARVLGMRRTMFVVPINLVPVIHAACTRDLSKRERRRTIRFIENAGIAKDGGRWLRKIETATLQLLQARGKASAAELSTEIPALRKKIPVGAGTKWEGTIGVSTRVLFLLANDGKIVRTRPRGTWLSTQYQWAPLDSWLGIDIDELDTESARKQLVRLWLRSYGPGTFTDLKWWTGWNATHASHALAGAGAVEIDLVTGTGYLLQDDHGPETIAPSSAALLPSLDPTTMGWSEREWYLGAHRARIFDRNGNAGPTVWWEGRIVGGWAQRPDGEVVFRLLEDVGSDARAAIEQKAQELGSWLGEVRIIPRFRTPVEKELGS
jgi:DNA glycosylase AlkZ-like